MTSLFSDCPTWLDAETWTAYCEWRAGLPRKQRMTDFARKLILKELDRLRAQGHNPTECLKQSLMNCWLGVFPCKAHQQALDRAQPTVAAHPASASVNEVIKPHLSREEIIAAARAAKARRAMQ